MIFVTIGSMFPFERLIRAMDAWAGRVGTEDLLAQIGDGSYQPTHMRWVRRLDRADFAATIAQCRLVVAHAGFGSIVTAGEYGKPVVVLPRRYALGEHTSDHQLETVDWLRAKPGIYVADGDDELPARIDDALAGARGGPGPLAKHAPPEFIARLRQCLLTLSL